MNVYQVGAGGYRATGMAIVRANTPERATELANKASRERTKDVNTTDYDLTYHVHNAHLILGIVGMPAPANRHDRRPPRENVVALHEYGAPELPSKGSGIKVTF